MAGRRVETPGRKFSVWISGENQLRLKEQDISPGEAIDRGLTAGDQVPVPPELEKTLVLIARLATVLANGGRIAPARHEHHDATAPVLENLREKYAES